MTGGGGSGHILVNYDRVSSVCMTGLSSGPGTAGLPVLVQQRFPSFTGPTLSLMRGDTPGRALVEPPICNRGTLLVRWPAMRSSSFVL